jgi:hypothetical protein
MSARTETSVAMQRSIAPARRSLYESREAICTTICGALASAMPLGRRRSSSVRHQHTVYVGGRTMPRGRRTSISLGRRRTRRHSRTRTCYASWIVQSRQVPVERPTTLSSRSSGIGPPCWEARLCVRPRNFYRLRRNDNSACRGRGVQALPPGTAHSHRAALLATPHGSRAAGKPVYRPEATQRLDGAHGAPGRGGGAGEPPRGRLDSVRDGRRPPTVV